MSVLPVKSAGVLPYSINSRGDINVLLGREGYAPGWHDSDKWGLFGGKVESGESAQYAAARECYEESAGVLFSEAELRQKLLNCEFSTAIDVTFKKSRFMCYCVQVPYRSDYPVMFRRVKEFVQYTGGSVECIEKTQIKWFPLEELRREIVPGAVRKRTYGRRPVFRKKFLDTMRFFFSVDGAASLKTAVETSEYYRNVPQYLHCRVEDKKYNLRT